MNSEGDLKMSNFVETCWKDFMIPLREEGTSEPEIMYNDYR